MNDRRYIFLFVIMFQCYSSLAWGDEFRLVPSITLQEQYNSNILLTSDKVLTTSHVKGDFISIFSGGVEMVERTERFDSDALIKIDRLEYIDNRDLSDTNQLYNGRIRYLLTPVLGVSAKAGFNRTSNPTLDYGTPVGTPPGTIIYPSPPPSPSPPGPPGPPGPPVVPAAVTPLPVVSVPRNTITGSLSSDYQFTEKTQATLTYTYGKDYYSDPRFQDDESHEINAGIVYDLGQYFPRVKGNANMGYGHYHFPDSRNDNVMGTVGFSRDLNEIWSILFDGGIRHTWSDIDTIACVPLNPPDPLPCKTVRKRLNNDEWGWLAGISLQYRGESFQGSLSYNRDFTAASGFGGAAGCDSFTLSTQYRLTYELSAVMTTGYYKYKSDRGETSAVKIDQDNFFVVPGVRYDFSKDMFVEASYGFTRVNNSGSNCINPDTGSISGCSQSSSNADRHIASVRFYIQHAFLE